jgi:cobalt/nickel transport system permease protein
MHIPDGFLSMPVWGTMDAVALPTVAYLARRAQREFDHHKIPLMGVMGAFIFAAQMINFPVGNGTSGHLVGGALLAFTLGPAAAVIAMTAILITQALVFQDGGLLALGANVFNMAIAGVLVGYLPYALLRGRKTGVFLGGMFSLLMSAGLALAELIRSGVPMPRTVLWVSIGLFAISAVIEGAITVAVVEALERIQPGFLRRPEGLRGRGMWVLAGASVAFAGVGVFVASTMPDGIERLTLPHAAVSRPVAGLMVLALVYLVCTGVSRAFKRESMEREGA